MLGLKATTLNKISLAILMIGVVVLVVVITSKQMRREAQRGDLEVYVHASQLMLEGRDIYTTPTERGNLYYVYLPLFAILTIPLTPLPPAVLLAFWCVLNVLLACWIVKAFFETISGESFFSLSLIDKWIMGLIPLLLSIRAIIYQNDLAQSNLFVLAVAVAGLKWLSRGSDLRAGAAVGVSVILKVLTFPLIILFAVRRNFRFTFGAAIGIAAGLVLPAIVLGFGTNLSYISYWFFEIATKTDVTSNYHWGFKFNFSPEAQMFRFFSTLPAFENKGREYYLTIEELPKGTIQMMGKAFLAALAGLIIFYGVRFRNASELAGKWGGVALCFCLMPILSPVTQKHYFSLMLPAHVYVVYLWHCVGLKDKWFQGLVIASFVWMTMTTNIVGSTLGAVMTGSGGLIWSTLVLAAAIFRAAYRLDRSPADGEPESTVLPAAITL